MHKFKVLVPLAKPRRCRGRMIDRVSYPDAGCPLYTREEALAIIRRFAERGQRECWAESETERFDLQLIDEGI